MKHRLLMLAAALALPAGTARAQTAPTPVVTPPIAYAVSTSASVGTSSTTILTAGQVGRTMKICTLFTSTSNVWLNLAGGTAAVNSGLGIPAGGGCKTLGAPDTPMPTGAVTGITDGASAQTVTMTGG